MRSSSDVKPVNGRGTSELVGYLEKRSVRCTGSMTRVQDCKQHTAYAEALAPVDGRAMAFAFAGKSGWFYQSGSPRPLAIGLELTFCLAKNLGLARSLGERHVRRG